MTVMTKEQIEALLDECAANHCGNDLARTALALHQQLADAKAAQAMVVERAAKLVEKRAEEYDREFGIYDYTTGVTEYPGTGSESMEEWESISAAIRALAPASGVEALAALRAERDALETAREMLGGFWAKAIAERDDALARLAAAEAQVQALRVERDELKQKLISPDPYEDTAHFDDHSVNRFAAVMKGKLASKRLQGRGGWQEPEVPNGYLSRLLREHVDKGDPVDVANFAMMIHQRGERIAPENEGASCKAIDKAEADRDRLAAANAALEAQVARMVGALEPFRLMSGELFARNWNASDVVIALDNPGDPHRLTFGDFLELHAALAEVQADARRDGGE